MKTSKHAEVRSQQRGISRDQIDLIISHGRKFMKPGGALEYRLLKRDKNQIISMLKEQINMVEKSVGKGVLVSNDNNEVIMTVYHLTK